jgi:hypothetical protein
MPHGAARATGHGMTKSTNPSIARHLSATLALQSATTYAQATMTSSRDVRAVDPMIAAKMRWVRAVLRSVVEGRNLP